jgi:hypothetical protein
MILPLPNGTVLETVLKYEADRLHRSGYVPAFEVPAEVIERRRFGDEFCHLVLLESSQEDGQVLNRISDTNFDILFNKILRQQYI